MTSLNRKLGLFLFGLRDLDHVRNHHLLDALNGSQASVRLSYACRDVRTCPYRTAVALRLRCAFLVYERQTHADVWKKTIFTHLLPSQALEPYISKQIMELHHTKHHQAYVTGLNAAEEQLKKVKSIEEQISLQAAIKFNGGGAFEHVAYSLRSLGGKLNICSLLFFILGHINHSFFWKILAPTSNGGGQLSDGKLKSTLEKDFGSVEDFKKAFNTKAAALQGSGWCWLVRISWEH